ncbi:hypothetical protein [Streptomyces sp. KR80]|uniref:hypothetical protein n=1 Tax=Streptomyces sp. KR80 TaxID=3457426 RepID=UPI003FD15FBC
MDGSREDAVTGLAHVLDRLGGPLGVIVPLALTGCPCVYGRWRSGLFVFITGHARRLHHRVSRKA